MVPRLLADLIDRDGRPGALDALARLHGADALLVLVPDVETGRLRPAPGLAQTLPAAPRWRALMLAWRDPGERDAWVEDPAGGPDRLVRAWTTPDGDVLAFLGGDPAAGPKVLAPLHRLVCALFRAEQAADLAAVRSRLALDAAAQSDGLVAALDAARRQLAGKAAELADVLVAAERANDALTRANASLEASRRAAERAASHDALTGVASRAAFERSLAAATERAGAQGSALALLLIDLDDIKALNDLQGHAAGDAVLRAVGAGLAAACQDGMAVGRIGGDEFAVAVPGLGTEAALALAERLGALVRSPVACVGGPLAPGCTIGVASVPADAGSTTDLMRKASLALSDTKQASKGSVGRYSAEIEEQFASHRRAVAVLRDALDRGTLEAHYQPKVALPDGGLVGFEALVRLRAPDGSVTGPSAFAQALADRDSVRLLGARMLDLVLADLVAHRAAGARPLPVSINVTGPEISRPGFAETILARLAAAGLPPTLIEIEITETALLGDHPARVRAALGLLRSAGLSVALDDFGTGYSSLSHLLDWDVDCIKIDRSFVGDFAEGARSTRIVRSILDLARGLDLRVVAEGVETQVQARHLAALGCPFAQGYLFGRAAPAAETLFALPRL